MKRIETQEEYLLQKTLAKENLETYWENIGHTFNWSKPWDKVHSGSFSEGNIKWFEGGKTNITENCLDRHLGTEGNKRALLYIANDPNIPAIEYTFRELHSKVCRFANMLKARNIQKGDRVVFYMAMVPDLLIGVLACARIGAIHSVVFGGFSALALAGRIQDCEATILVTNDSGMRGTKEIPLKNISDEALETCPTIKTVLVSRRTGAKIEMLGGRDHYIHDLIQKESTECAPEKMDAEDPLFILYTSGSTGKPKGLCHTTAGYMVWAAQTYKNVFQVNEDDLYWCTADIGWITGHSYITYGPLLNGDATVMFEGIPTYPDAGRFWHEVQKHKITHFYTAPTAIRALMAHGDNFVTKYDLTSLKVLGTVGEPINIEAWNWYHKIVGDECCPIVDTWWQTETGGIMISNLAGVTKAVPTCASTPLPGVEPALMGPDGKEMTSLVAAGNLCLKTPWPGIARTIWGDHTRYMETYFSTYKGYYFTGDGARRDEEGLYRITGRVDDVINVSGHRIGTAEVEDAINQHPDVVESAVVGFPHQIKGQGIYAYIIPSTEIKDLEAFNKDVSKVVMKMIGAIARPDKIQVTAGLPKTRSGKIMRRILRKVAAGEVDQLGDVSTLLNPEIVESLIKGSAK